MLIRVTKEHIKKGKHNCKDCPIALALKEMGYSKVYACYNYLYVAGAMIKTTKPMQRFMENFDNFCPVKPHTFRVKL